MPENARHIKRQRTGKLLVVRRPHRRGLLIANGMSKANPGLLFSLDGVDAGELDELIRAILAKGGITAEAEVQAIIERAEEDAEVRLKVAEAKAEIRRAMEIRKKGLSLIQRGYRKWVECFMPARTVFKSD